MFSLSVQCFQMCCESDEPLMNSGAVSSSALLMTCGSIERPCQLCVCHISGSVTSARVIENLTENQNIPRN